MISKEQAKQIKEQLLKQVESLPENQKEPIKKQIEEMNEEQLEQFLKQNSEQEQECIFCSIINGRIPSYKILENESAIAILEINPISEGHVIIIPKVHVKSNGISENVNKLAEEVSKKIVFILKPKNISISSSEIMEHGLINVLPIYNNETLSSKRKKASENELKSLKERLTKPIEIKEEKPKEKPIVKKETPEEKARREKEEIKKLPKAPKRIP